MPRGRADPGLGLSSYELELNRWRDLGDLVPASQDWELPTVVDRLSASIGQNCQLRSLAERSPVTAMEPGTIRHRKDIDGLRALAVLPIVLFHAGIPGFSGGFVGVDIFFVISGFLVTSIIARDISAQSFSFAKFYERRIRRIFPALAGMLLCSLVAAYFIVLPSEMADFARSVIGTILFASNIVFYSQTGYFDDASEEKLLLHTWSLGVEEQFYIAFPIFLFLVIRYYPGFRLQILALCAALSLALCIYFTRVDPSAAFYLIPFRAWELLAGSLVALGAAPQVSAGRLRDLLSALGFALIVMAVWMLDSGNAFPGKAALLPVTGSALIVAYGEKTIMGRLLSIRPLVGIGLISYSLYLWHWPLVTAGRDLGLLDGRIGPAVGVVIVSIAAGYLSYRFIETPFRDRARFSQSKIFGLAAVGSVALLIAGFGYLHSDGLRGRYSSEILAFDDGRSDISPLREKCHIQIGTPNPAEACVIGGKRPDTALWGDSHGVELAYAFASPAHPIQELTYSACPPVPGIAIKSRPDCLEHNGQVARYLRASPEIRTVIIAAHYRLYMKRPGLARRFAEVVGMLQEAGKTVVIIGPPPQALVGDVPRRLARSGNFRIPVKDYQTRERKVIELLESLKEKGAWIIWPSDYFCDAMSCAVTTGGRPVLFDSHHMSLSGAKYLAARTAPQVWNHRATRRPATPFRSAS